MSGERFTVLIDRHEKELFRFCISLSDSYDEAKDLFQEATIKAYLNRRKIDDISKFKSWVATIIYNAHLGKFRKRKRRRNLMESKGRFSDTFFNQKTCSNNGFENLKAEDIRKLRSRINPTSYEAFLLYTRGYSYKEIAEQHDVALGTVKSRIHSTRQKLSKLCKLLGIAA